MASKTQQLIDKHPLQRLSSPSRGASLCLHIAGLISFALSYKYLFDWPTPISDSYGWHWQYLTILGLTVATASFFFGLLADITLSPTFFFVKNSLSLCSAPLEVLISILYWGISAIDRTLVVPPEIHIALNADIGFHAMPAILLTLDLLFFSPPWTMAVAPAMGLSSVIACSYWWWVEHCFKHNGWYPYPLFAALDTTQRAGLFASAALTMTASTMLLKWLYGRVNGLQGAQNKARPGNVKAE